MAGFYLPASVVFLVGRILYRHLPKSLRIHSNTPTEKNPAMRHKLLKTIDKEFRKAGIITAFPQRDVHVDLKKPWLSLFGC